MQDHPYKPIDVDSKPQEEEVFVSKTYKPLEYMKGPWELSVDGDNYQIKGEGCWIAKTYGGFGENKQRDHARLLAAAPEMYELLQDFLGEVNFFARQQKLRELMKKLEKK